MRSTLLFFFSSGVLRVHSGHFFRRSFYVVPGVPAVLLGCLCYQISGAKHSPPFLKFRGPFGLDPEVLRVRMGKSCFHQFRSRYQLWSFSRTISHFRLSKVIFRTSVNCWNSCRKVGDRSENVKILGVLESDIFMVSGRLRRLLEVFFYVFGAQLRKANDLLRVCEPLRILLLLAALWGCVFSFASSGTALCCYVCLSCGTVIYDLAGFRSCSGSLLVQPLLQNICTSVGSLSML